MFGLNCGTVLPVDTIERRPGIPLSLLAAQAELDPIRAT